MLRRPGPVLALLAIAALVVMVLFMTIKARGAWDFVLPFRGRKLAALLVVGHAVAVSTVLFQTVTANRILTPSIMGFDALYVLVSTALVFFFGATRLTTLDPQLKFAIDVILMALFAALLFRWLFSGGTRSLHLLVLVGIVFGILFRSLNSFMQRMIDPNEFDVLQDVLFASFNAVDETLLGISAVAIVVVSVLVWRERHALDVLSLGRDHAINLGLDHRRAVTRILFLVTILVSVSTALVGPVTFFGLLVANLAWQVAGSARHVHVLPVAVLLAAIALVGGQLVLERVFALNASLSMVIEFIGGVVFIALLVRRGQQ
ncbi:MAG: iron chelate uptake ABC transporter family permease subunit [Bauldia sp.]|nr:iron chelate uptake ABC transporter family permease subunit [Bauldia sp.]